MKKLTVLYAGWGERWPLGMLAHGEAGLLFEYSAEALKQGLELSPLRLPLRQAAYGDMPGFLDQLPGLIADSLPDGWGRLLMDRDFRRLGVDPATASPLDRLACLGDRTMGALCYEPAPHEALEPEILSLLELGREVKAVEAGKGASVLHRLAVMGGSPHGARPKVLVHLNATTGEMGTTPLAGSTPWLVKFPAREDHKEVCGIERAFALLAEACDLDMPRTKHFDLDRKLAAFAIERFDIAGTRRVPVHTLAGLLHADFRAPSLDYLAFLRATRQLTRDEREVKRAFERAVFNVLFNNRDDHAKNFSYVLGQDRHWRLAPCYDLTFNEGPRGEHQTSVNGEGRSVTRAHMQSLARQAALPGDFVDETIEQMTSKAELLGEFAPGHGIRKATVKHIAAAIDANRGRLRK